MVNPTATWHKRRAPQSIAGYGITCNVKPDGFGQLQCWLTQFAICFGMTRSSNLRSRRRGCRQL